MLNKLITNSINIHTPLKIVKLTRQIAPWMHDSKIIELQKELASQRETYRNHELQSTITTIRILELSFKKL